MSSENDEENRDIPEVDAVQPPTLNGPSFNLYPPMGWQWQAPAQQPAAAAVMPAVMPGKTAVAEKPKKKRKGDMRFTSEEKKVLVEIIEQILPIGPEQWETVTEDFNNSFDEDRARLPENLRKQFRTLYRKKALTGDPNIPDFIRKAKSAQEGILNKANCIKLGEYESDDSCAGLGKILSVQGGEKGSGTGSGTDKDKDKEESEIEKPPKKARSTKKARRTATAVANNNAEAMLQAFVASETAAREARAEQEKREERREKRQEKMMQMFFTTIGNAISTWSSNQQRPSGPHFHGMLDSTDDEGKES